MDWSPLFNGPEVILESCLNLLFDLGLHRIRVEKRVLTQIFNENLATFSRWLDLHEYCHFGRFQIIAPKRPEVGGEDSD